MEMWLYGNMAEGEMNFAWEEILNGSGISWDPSDKK